MDQLIYGFSNEKKISLTFVDVTDTAKELEKKHLSGPTAGRFLAEALVSVALLSGELGQPDERISLQAQVDGPIGGCFVDASKDGSLRGYSNIKILNKFDESDQTPLAEVLGDNGAITLIHSSKFHVLSQKRFQCSPLNLRHGIARYYNDDQNKPTAVEISAVSRSHYLHNATGLMVTRMPEGDSEDFVPLLERFNDKTIQKALNQMVDIELMGARLGLNDLKIIEKRPLKFNCTCSHEKVINSLSCMKLDELNEFIETKTEPEVTCHFCSNTYRVSIQEVTNLILSISEKPKE